MAWSLVVVVLVALITFIRMTKSQSLSTMFRVRQRHEAWSRWRACYLQQWRVCPGRTWRSEMGRSRNFWLSDATDLERSIDHSYRLSFDPRQAIAPDDLVVTPEGALAFTGPQNWETLSRRSAAARACGWFGHTATRDDRISQWTVLSS